MAENEPEEDPKSPQDARLASLDERLRQAQADEAARTGSDEQAAAGLLPVAGLSRAFGADQLSARQAR